MNYEISVVKTFSAAHALREYKGKCENLHGHNWKIKAAVGGDQLGHAGMLLDFTDLKSMLDDALSALDHKNLNEVSPFDKTNPTAENIAAYIYNNLKDRIPAGAVMSYVEVWESENSSAKYSERINNDGMGAVDAGRHADRIEKLINSTKKALYYGAMSVILVLLVFTAVTFVHFDLLGHRKTNDVFTRQAKELKIDSRDVVKNPGKYIGKPIEWHCKYLKGNSGIVAGSDVQIEILGMNTENIKTGKMFAYTVIGSIKSVQGNLVTIEGVDIFQTK